jgi:hypothetical protein
VPGIVDADWDPAVMYGLDTIQNRVRIDLTHQYRVRNFSTIRRSSIPFRVTLPKFETLGQKVRGLRITGSRHRRCARRRLLAAWVDQSNCLRLRES